VSEEDGQEWLCQESGGAQAGLDMA